MSLVSVVVPTRNRAVLLQRTLQSICAQQNVDLEVIVIDDASTDDTPDVARATDPRVMVLRNRQQSGVSISRNRGIAAARGEWIAFCDDDDLWAPDKLAAQLTMAEAMRAGWVYAGDVNIDGRMRIISGAPPPPPATVMTMLPRVNPLASGGSNVVVRANVLATTGGFDTRLRRTEDWDLWVRLARIGRPACVFRPLVAYRFHSSNVTSDLAPVVAESRILARQHGIPVDLTAMHRRAAWMALRVGARREAIRHYVCAIARGDLRSVGRLAFALACPAGNDQSLFRLLRQDTEWIAQAREWLTALDGFGTSGQHSTSAHATGSPEPSRLVERSSSP